MTALLPPPEQIVAGVLRRALDEDLGLAGDVTTNAVIAEGHVSTGRLVARSPGTIAGLSAATKVFTMLDRGVVISLQAADGESVDAGLVLAEITGSTRAILTGERTCLNLLGRLSGIATATARMVRLVEGTAARIADTRKTTPGLRALEKYAVRCGGGVSHRFGLADAVLIKDNHLAAVGSLTTAVKAAREAVGHTVAIEVEVEDLGRLEEALAVGVDAVLLDNMTSAQLEEAVAIVDGRCITEASGGVTQETVRTVAATGVDIVSVGWLTHSAPHLDVALDL